MDYEWEEQKSLETLAKRGYDFSIVYDFDWTTAIITHDERYDYGEARFRAHGRIGEKPFCVAFTLRETNIRIISVFRIHEKEARRRGI